MEDLNVQTIAIPVEEYKELLQKQAELSLIYHKGARGSVYDIGNFVAWWLTSPYTSQTGRTAAYQTRIFMCFAPSAPSSRTANGG